MVIDIMDTDLHAANQLGNLEDTHKQNIIYQVFIKKYFTIFNNYESVEVYS